MRRKLLICCSVPRMNEFFKSVFFIRISFQPQCLVAMDEDRFAGWFLGEWAKFTRKSTLTGLFTGRKCPPRHHKTPFQKKLFRGKPKFEIRTLSVQWTLVKPSERARAKSFLYRGRGILPLYSGGVYGKFT